MKTILFILSVLAMMVVVGCSTPTTDNSVEEETVVTATETPVEPQEPETPAVQEDKSPYEYVKPDCVNLDDYTYVGDYIFADTMNFAEWKYSNSETNYLLAFEKIARVKNDNPDTRIRRCNHNDPNTEIPVIKATKYKIYVNNERMNETIIFSNVTSGFNDTYDGTRFRIVKRNDGTIFIGNASEDVSGYVEY
ncbi:hypothetical protein [Treponema bryantii]|uniref:hypothetical protein n=1 Tax=Treponema bryantii TaxID=163 RepID=UPI0003B57A3C|nr:hypothetical protein [Treponema bryantii]